MLVSNIRKPFSPKEFTFLLLMWIFTIGLFIHAALLVYFYRFYQTPSVTWETKTFPVVDNTIVQGEPIQLVVVRCSKDNYVASIKREAIDTIAYSIPIASDLFEKGCISQVRIIPDVSKVLPPGEYHLINHVEVKVSWLYFSRVDKYDTASEQFYIISNK